MKKLLFLEILFISQAVFMMSACTSTTVEKIPERTMNVDVGPDRVFDRPVGEILPALRGAAPTGANGRIGNEMVFWGYRLDNGRNANLFACAMLYDVDCEARLKAVCPSQGEELVRAVEPGKVRYLNCRAIGVAAPGDLRPNCNDTERTYDLLVGLMQCR